jgi:hypothetical protein
MRVQLVGARNAWRDIINADSVVAPATMDFDVNILCFIMCSFLNDARKTGLTLKLSDVIVRQ